MAGTLVHIILSGIVSIVPQQDGTYVLRLQDAREEAMRHVISLVTERQNTRPTSPEPERRAPDDPSIALYYGWLLGNGTMTIPDAPATGGVDVSAMVNVLRIGDSCKSSTCGVMDRAKFRGVELKVRGGWLTTAGLEPYRWYFGNEPAEAARRIAEEICWTFEIPGDTLKFKVPGRDQMFEIGAPPGEDIEIRLQNAPERDAIPVEEDGLPEMEDMHFQLYYALSAAPPQPLVALLREKERLALPIDPPYRLSGRRMVRDATQVVNQRVSGAARLKGLEFASRGWHVVRVNCPPGLWDGELVP